MSRKSRHKEPSGASEQTPAKPSGPEHPAAAEPQNEPDALRCERDDLLGRLQRLSADYLNYQKRVQRDVAEAREYGNAELIKSLLDVLDDMQRALEAARSNHDEDDPLLQGMQLVYDKAMETLGRYGLTVIKAEGECFDPTRHNALMQEASCEYPPGTVLRELQKGFQLKGRTIRPAAVVVTKAPQEDETQAEDQENREPR